MTARTVIEQIAPALSAAIGPAALAEIASAVLFLAMLAVWGIVFLGD